MSKKYKLTNETKTAFGRTLFRIEALMSLGSVSKGDKGGWIEKEENLSQSENAWVYGNAWVSGNATVSGNARVSGNAWVFGKIKLISGYFFGWKKREEELKYFNNNNDNQLIGKGDCEVEYYEEIGRQQQVVDKTRGQI
jgi:hypothetical protein